MRSTQAVRSACGVGLSTGAPSEHAFKRATDRGLKLLGDPSSVVTRGVFANCLS